MSNKLDTLIKQSEQLFTKKLPLLSMWQTLAENFDPMRADFTTSRSIGEEFSSHLMSGRPLLAQRDLGNAVSTMLRPRGSTWFHPRTTDDRTNEDLAALQWLDAKGETMRRVMYDPRAKFIRSTKQGDNDFITYGQTVIEITPNSTLDGLLYRTWHLRDCAWQENAELDIDTLYRKWKIPVKDLVKLFPKTVKDSHRRLATQEPFTEINCLHCVIPNEDETSPLPFRSIFIDVDNSHELEDVPRRYFGYVVPRWVTVSGSQYAHSPATVVALPDARMLQQITLTLLESGQKAVDPPLKATHEGVVGAVNTFAGGITWVDSQYDERTGPALEPLMDAPRGLNWGNDREQQIIELIQEAFFLNKIALPPSAQFGDRATKFETQQRVEEYIRGALPLFEPMEVEYNGAVCQTTWDIMMGMGGFGNLQDMPESLHGKDLKWTFESPLQAANERSKAQAYGEASQLLAQAVALDPTLAHDFNLDKAFRDAVLGVGSPSEWLVDEEVAARSKEQHREALAAAEAAQGAQEVLGAQGQQ